MEITVLLIVWLLHIQHFISLYRHTDIQNTNHRENTFDASHCPFILKKMWLSRFSFLPFFLSPFLSPFLPFLLSVLLAFSLSFSLSLVFHKDMPLIYL